MSLFEKIQNRKSLWSDVAFGSSSRSSAVSEDAKEPAPFPPPRARRTAGWSDDSNKSKSRHSSISDLDRFKSPERTTIIDSDDDIPAIPDLEDMQDDYPKMKVTSASIFVNEMSQMKEPDSDPLQHPSFSNYDDNLMRILTKTMNAENEVKEDDVPKTWQQLFTEISIELLS